MTITDQINDFAKRHNLSDTARAELLQLSFQWMVDGAKQANKHK